MNINPENSMVYQKIVFISLFKQAINIYLEKIQIFNKKSEILIFNS